MGKKKKAAVDAVATLPAEIGLYREAPRPIEEILADQTAHDAALVAAAPSLEEVQASELAAALHDGDGGTNPDYQGDKTNEDILADETAHEAALVAAAPSIEEQQAANLAEALYNDGAIMAACRFAAAILGAHQQVSFRVPDPGAFTQLVGFLRDNPDASAEALYIFGSARQLFGEGSPSSWSELEPITHLEITAFVAALHLADKLNRDVAAAAAAAIMAEEAAGGPPVPVADTIFETLGAETGFDPDYRRHPAAGATEPKDAA